MNPELEKLEHLISRALDGECTSDERKLLKSRLRNDPQARALFDELRTLDEALGDALRRATRRTWHIISVGPGGSGPDRHRRRVSGRDGLAAPDAAEGRAGPSDQVDTGASQPDAVLVRAVAAAGR